MGCSGAAAGYKGGMKNPTVILIVLCAALAVHYVAQKQLLAKGRADTDPRPQINRLLANGFTLIVLSIFTFIAYRLPYGLFGVLLLIEGGICLLFARKLKRK